MKERSEELNLKSFDLTMQSAATVADQSFASLKDAFVKP
jgi:hypothetical protein